MVLLLGALAPLLAPRPPDLQEDVAGSRFMPPLTRADLIRLPSRRELVVTALRPRPGGWEYVRAGRREQAAASLLEGAPEPRFYLLGTDGLGRDLASRVLYGLRHSAAIAALSVALALGLGVTVGASAGMLGRRWDALLMGSVDALRSIPRLLLYLVCASLFPPSTLLLVLVLGATTWTGLARIVRAQMLALRAGDLAAAARAVGSRPLRTVLRHLLPQMLPVLAVDTALRFADTLLLESALSLLGLGAPAPAVSLGGIMASGRDALAEAWWIVVWPGLLISGLLLSLRSTAAALFRISDPPSVA
jgi:peptide/nickel transport system permease protein